MAWPLATHFTPMLQNPALGFKDAELKSCVIEKDGKGQPRPRSGAFAVVYKATLKDGRDRAVRIFTKESQERRERYAAIDDYFKSQVAGLQKQGKLKSLVAFTYDEAGIKSVGDGKWYPLVTMDWVGGDVLFDWLRKQCTTNQKQTLQKASDQWISLIGELADAKIAHGDLQHGNVMVTPQNELKLVDYDCMCVPKLVGKRNLEIGVDPYQHPQRNEETELYAGLDNFSAAFILVALKALSADPQLWARFVEPPHGELYDKLLFRAEDFHDPLQSPLFQDLRRSPEPNVRKWADDLCELFRAPLKEVPSLEDFVTDRDAIRSVLDQKDFDKALEMLSKTNAAKVPPDLKPRLDDARQRVQAREQLEQAVQSGDEDGMQRLYTQHGKLLDDYPRARQAVTVAKQAAHVVPVLRELQQAQQSRSWRQLVTAWDRHQAALIGRKSCEKFKADVDTWRERNAACDAVLALLQRNPPDPAALKPHWDKLRRTGHPDLDARKPEIEGLLERHEAYTRLTAVPRTVTEASDTALSTAWIERLFANWAPAEAERPRVTAAQDRLAIVDNVRSVLQQASVRSTLGGEKALVAAAEGLASGYAPDIDDRIDRARQTLAAIDRLNEVFQRKPHVEEDIAAAWEAVLAAGAAGFVSAAGRQRCEEAVARAGMLSQVSIVDLSLPPHERDAAILAAWNGAGDVLNGVSAAAPWRQAYEQACKRQEMLFQIEQLFDAGQTGEVDALAQSPLFAGYAFPEHIADRVAASLERANQLKDFIAILTSGRTAGFREAFSAELVRANAVALAPHHKKIAALIRSEILPLAQTGMTLPLVGKAVQPVPGGRTIKLRWNWPPERFSQLCFVKVTRGQPPASAPFDSVEGFKIAIDKKDWYATGFRIIPVKPEWNRAHVAVWACIDVGFEKFYSEPLVLGVIG